jgi:S-adenosylmethionine-diacylglycerol 3-amino-3-carboxypropyl transferase
MTTAAAGARGPLRRAWQRLKDRFVYSPLAFAETAEAIAPIHRVLSVGPGDRVAGIASSGDVLLSLLPLGPEQVLGFDFNPAQTAVAALKLELYRRADRDTYERFMGMAPCEGHERRRIFESLAPRLGDLAAVADRLPIEQGVLNHGMSAWLSRLIDLALRVNLSRASYERVLDVRTGRDERLALFEEFRASRVNRLVAAPLLRIGRHAFKHFLFPPAQCANSDYPARALMDAPELARPMFRAGFADNPVVGRHITGRIPGEHETYLFSRAAWDGIRAHADRISFATASLDVAIAALPAASLDAIYLSNAPDYLKRPGLESFAGAVRHAARPRARVFYLSLDPSCPFANAGVATPWTLDRDLARDLMDQDTAGVYRYLGAGVVGG